MQRIKTLEPEDMTAAQRAVFEAIASGPRGEVPILFQPWLRSPELADRAQKLGAFLRYDTSLPARLSELAILAVARHWTAQFEWYSHVGPARAAGLAPDIIAALAENKRPDFTAGDEALVYDFVTELQIKRDISDATYGATVDELGETAVAELVGVVGYYTMAAMTLNAFRLPAPASPPLDPLD